MWGGYYEDGGLIWRSPLDHRDRDRRVPRSARLPRRSRSRGAAAPDHRRPGRRPGRGGPGTRGRVRPGHLRELHRDDEGRWEGRVGDLRMRWTGGAAAAVHGEAAQRQRLTSTVTLPEEPTTTWSSSCRRRHLGEPPDPDRAWQATETAWRDAVPQLGATHRPAGRAALLRGAARADQLRRRAWSPPRRWACPNAPRRAATTTTGTCGSATSATPGRPCRWTRRTRCWTTRSGSSPRASSTTDRT